MQSSPDQIRAYLYWLSDRGMKHPAPRVTPQVVDLFIAKAQRRVMFVGDHNVMSEAERSLLEKMIYAMQLTPEQVVIVEANVKEILEKTSPELIVALGAEAAQTLMGSQVRFHETRGKIVPSPTNGGLATLVTIHPRDLLRVPEDKRLAWSDLKVVMARLGLARSFQ